MVWYTQVENTQFITQYWEMWGQGNGYVLMMMSKTNIQVYPFRKVGFVLKCTSQGTESLYGSYTL